MPVSSTSSADAGSPSSLTRTSIRPPGSVYLQRVVEQVGEDLLDARAGRRRRRPARRARPSARIRRALELRLRGRAAAPARHARHVDLGERESGCWRPSTRESSRMSSIRRCEALGVAQDHVEVGRALRRRARALARSVSAKPRIAVSGVLSSCETLATKSRRMRSRRRISVTSWSTATTPRSGPLAGKAHGVELEVPRLGAPPWRRRSTDRRRPAPRPSAIASCTSTRRTTSQCGRPTAVAPEAEELAHARVREHDALLGVDDEHALDHAGEHGLQPLLVLGELAQPRAQLLGHPFTAAAMRPNSSGAPRGRRRSSSPSAIEPTTSAISRERAEREAREEERRGGAAASERREAGAPRAAPRSADDLAVDVRRGPRDADDAPAGARRRASAR